MNSKYYNNLTKSGKLLTLVYLKIMSKSVATNNLRKKQINRGNKET